MATPWKHPETGTYYLRERVPLDVAGKTKGKKVSLHVNGMERTVTLGETVKVSFGTKDPKIAKERHRAAMGTVDEIWTQLRDEAANGPVRLTGRQVEALAGQYYRQVVKSYEDDPGPPHLWDGPLSGAEDLMDASRRVKERHLGEVADRLVQRAGLTMDIESRGRLLDSLARSAFEAVMYLSRRADGDYSPDGNLVRFPDLSVLPTKEVPYVKEDRVKLSDLYAAWKADKMLLGGSDKTAKDFRQKLDSLIAFLGHEDAMNITPKQIADRTAHLRHDEGLSAKTVGEKYLATIKRLFTVGKRKFLITDNPAADVTVEDRQTVGIGKRGYNDTEALAILSASLLAPTDLPRWSVDNRRAIRWGPWLCAYNGSRITEMMQLLKEDVEIHRGIPCIRITPESGSTKSGNERLVPLHPHLIEMGFLDMVADRPDGPLFYTEEVGLDRLTRARNAGAKIGTWVRSVVGITDDRIQPNHAWRHRFKTEARRLSIERWIVDAIQGHADGSASANYGEVPMEPLYEAIKRLPRYDVPDLALA